jgi:flavin reductase (DIM6/NTAB) family NADH-FMN oxidoreductase RutF
MVGPGKAWAMSLKHGGRCTVGADTQAFEAIIADIETPMYVVTTATGTDRGGCLVGFASQCSIEPPLFCVWLSNLNRTYRLAQAAATLVVHLLRHGDQDLARRFGGETGDEVDKFTDIAWHAGPGGCPVIARCDWFAGTIIDRLDTGDHAALVLTPWGGDCKHNGTPQLTFREIGDVRAGHPIPES